jgi:enoyl-CoA hydratase
LAERIALTPPEVLRLKKLSINRAAEAAGFRGALAGIADIDALLHLSPGVLALRARMKERGVKAMIEEFKVKPTNPFGPAEE